MPSLKKFLEVWIPGIVKVFRYIQVFVMPRFRLRQVSLYVCVRVCVCEPVCVCVYIINYNVTHAIRGRAIPLNPPSGIHRRYATSIYSDYVTNYADHQTIATFISLPNSFKLYGIV